MDRKFIVLSAGAVIILIVAIIAVAVLSVKQTNESITTSIVETPSRIGRSLAGTRRNSNTPVRKSPDGAYAKRGVITPAFGREAAQAILEWIHSQRVYGERLENPTAYGEFVSDGGYSTGTYCDADKKCTSNHIGNNLGLIATWAQYQYFKFVDRSPDTMRIIQNDLAIYENSKKISAIQPVLTNFKHMYELWSEGEFKPEQKEQIKNILYRMQHDPSIIDPVEALVAQSSTTISPRAVTTVRPFDTIQEFGVDSKADMHAILSSEYAYTYAYLRDSGDLDDYSKFLYTAIGLYNNALSAHNNPYFLGIAALDLFKVTGDTFYLRQAESVAAQTNSYPCGDTDLCATRIYFLHTLGRVSGNQVYLTKRNELLTPLITNAFDTQDLNGHKFGYNAFYSDKPQLTERYRYELDTNALLVSVLVDL